MAQITRFLFSRHLRSDPSHHVLHYHRGKLVKSGRGVAYWFMPLAASVAEVPCDDRELAFLFHARTADFQDVTTQGVITYRIAAPEKVAARINFSIDLVRGTWKQTPLEQIGNLLSQLAQQFAWDYVAHAPVRAVLAEGMVHAGDKIRTGFAANEQLPAMGLEIVTVRITGVAPTADVEKALQTPTREAIQQQADEATFQRRALAVEKERAIQENELQNKIELARREESLIGQQGANSKRLAREQAEAEVIAAEALAVRQRLEAGARAETIRTVQQARSEAEQVRVAIYKDLPPQVMLGLAAQRFAGKLQRVDHLNLGSEVLGSALTELLEAGTRRLKTPPSKGAQ